MLITLFNPAFHKKIILYISFYLQILPQLSKVLILCNDLGTDIVPCISFAYKYAVLDITVTHQRSLKWCKLVNSKIIEYS